MSASSAASAAAPAAATAAAGAGSSAPESALSAVAAALVPLGSVFVKRSADERAHFAEVEFFAGDTVARLAKRASKEIGWGVSAAYVEFFLVKKADSEPLFKAPTNEQIVHVLKNDDNVLGEGMPLDRAGIAPGAWIVARLSGPSVAASGACARAS